MNSIGKIRKLFLIGVIALAVVLIAACFFAHPPNPDPLPNPNGYDDFVAAGNMLIGDSPNSTATVEEFAAFVATNRPALYRAQLALSRQCRMPPNYSPACWSNHLVDLSTTKRIARALRAEGKLAELNNHPAQAATNYLMDMKMGVELTHGAVVMDAIVAISCETLGSAALSNEVPYLTAEQSRTLARQVEDLEATREPCQKIVEHEHTFWQSQLNGIKGLIQYLVTQKTLKSVLQKSISKYNQRWRLPLELETTLASHAFQLEKGHPPANWNDLVPAYLQKIPLDPGTTNPMPLVPQ